jgi:hypothetical protein
MYKRQRGCSGCLLLLFDLVIMAYLAAYVLGLVAHNGVTDFFIRGMELGMR